MRKSTLILVFLCLGRMVGAIPPPYYPPLLTSPFNAKQVPQGDSVGNYSFFVSAHFHGSSTNTSGLPAKTVLANINSINNSGTLFIAHLGDLFLDVKKDIPAYKENLFSRLSVPLFNAVGNHDLSGSVYQDNFGETEFYFFIGSDLFIFLDTEKNDGSIVNPQEIIYSKIEGAGDSVKNVFIFSHRLIWAEDHPELKKLFTDNTRSSNPGNFSNEILPKLRAYSKSMNIYLLGGSMGNAPAPFFFHKEKDANITYIATAIRDTPKDALLKVEMIDGKATFSAFAMPMSPEFYNLEYYKPSEQKILPFNWRLIPLYSKQALTHRYFWYGVLLMFIPLFFVYRMFKRRKK